MAAPTFVASVATAYNSSTTPKSAASALTISSGDVVAGGAGVEGSDTGQNFTFGTGTWTEGALASSDTAGNTAQCETATQLPSAGSLTPTIAYSGGGGAKFMGATWAQFSSSDGVGTSSTGTNGTGADSAPSWTLTTTQDNSAILAIVVDWNATDGASRTWRTVNSITPTAGNGLELTYFRDSVRYTVYVAYWSDAGAAGAKTLGISTPSTMRWVGAAVEIKGTASAAPALPIIVMPPRRP